MSRKPEASDRYGGPPPREYVLTGELRKVLVTRKPARCLDCPHSVGPEGDHYATAIGWVPMCRRCPPGRHELSMSLNHEGVWR